MKHLIKIIGKFNTLFLTLIVFAYFVCLVLVLIAISPKHSYVVVPKNTHNIAYQEVSNSFQVTYRRSLNSGKIDESYGIRVSIQSRKSLDDKTDQHLDINQYQYEYTQIDGMGYYFNEVNSVTTTWSKTTYVGEGHEPACFYSRVHYTSKDNEEKVVTYKEEVLAAPTSLKKYSNGNQITLGDTTFKYQVVAKAEDDNNRVSMRVVSNTTAFFHIDIQSWILDKDGKLYPFAGIYNYTNGNWNIDNELVIKELNPKAIVCKLVCYYEGEEFEMHYIEDFANLKENYSDFEDKEATIYNTGGNSKTNKIIAICAISIAGLIIVCVVVLGAFRVRKSKIKEQNKIVDNANTQKNIDIQDKN